MAYANLTEVKLYLGLENDQDDSILQDLISDAKGAIDNYCGQTFEATGDTTRYFTVGTDTQGRTLWLDGPLCQITTVKTNADNASPITLSSSEYVTIPRNIGPYHGIKILNSSSNVWEYTDDAEAGIEVTGRWAFSVSPPGQIRRACVRLAAFYYRQRDSQVFDTTAIPDAGVITTPQGFPVDVERMLKPYKRLGSW